MESPTEYFLPFVNSLFSLFTDSGRVVMTRNNQVNIRNVPLG